MENQFDDDKNWMNQQDKSDLEFADLVKQPDMEDKILTELKRRKLISSDTKPSVRWAALKIAAIFLIAVTTFIARYYWQELTGPKKQQYVLLLYRPSNFISKATHVTEYGHWLKNLIDSGNHAYGEALQTNQWLLKNNESLSANSGAGEKGLISGFFVIEANTYSEAIELAKSCPHLKYNGLVELRPILQLSK